MQSVDFILIYIQLVFALKEEIHFHSRWIHNTDKHLIKASHNRGRDID